MAKPSKSDLDSDESEEQKIEEIEEEDEEELEAVARTADSDDEDEKNSDSADDDVKSDNNDDDEDEEGGNTSAPEIGKKEKARLRVMQRLKKQKVQEILDKQNAVIDADMNEKGKGHLKYLLKQTEIFAHFAKGSESASQKKKPKGRDFYPMVN